MADPATKAAAIAIAAGAGGVIMPGVLDLNILVVIAAFAGAAGILSFMPAVSILRMAGTVFFSASAGIFGTVLAVRQVAWLKGGEPFAALAIAAVLQFAIPIAIENRARIFEALLALLPGRRPEPPKGGS